MEPLQETMAAAELKRRALHRIKSAHSAREDALDVARTDAVTARRLKHQVELQDVRVAIGSNTYTLQGPEPWYTFSSFRPLI